METALSSAMVRAAHLFMDGEPKIFRDGLALQLAGFDSRGELEFAIAQRHAAHARLHGAELARGAFDRARAIIAVRSRYAEDELASARRRGVGQYVILGAGMDSFAWRQRDGSTPLRLFEMDRPRTQHWKRTRLAHMGVALPENLFFVPIDFERQTLREVLDACGYRATEAAFFSCLGVTQYLTAAAVTAMLQSIGSLAPGSEVVFEYIVPEEQLQLEERCYVAAMHPPAVDGTQCWQTFFEPVRMADLLHDIGFVDVTDLDSEVIKRRYFRGRQDGLRPPAAAHLVKATVGGPTRRQRDS